MYKSACLRLLIKDSKGFFFQLLFDYLIVRLKDNSSKKARELSTIYLRY